MIDLMCQSSSDQTVSDMLSTMSQEQQIQFVELLAAFGWSSPSRIGGHEGTMTETGRRLEESLQQSNDVLFSESSRMPQLSQMLWQTLRPNDNNNPLTLSVLDNALSSWTSPSLGVLQARRSSIGSFRSELRPMRSSLWRTPSASIFAVSNLKDRAQHWVGPLCGM